MIPIGHHLIPSGPLRMIYESIRHNKQLQCLHKYNVYSTSQGTHPCALATCNMLLDTML